MTPMQPILAAPARSSPIPLQRESQVICIRWSSQPATGRQHHRVFVLEIELIGNDRAEVRAWLEHGAHRHRILEPRSFKAVSAFDGSTFNIDVMGDNGDGRIAAVSLPVGEQSARPEGPLYARTPLLSSAGFDVGAFDPPVHEWRGFDPTTG
jgi:hypothetical protein